MLPNLLLPRYFKFIGLSLYLIGFAINFYFLPDLLDATNGTSLLIQILILLGLLLFCNSKQKYEDEFIQHCRLKSIQWAVLLFVFLRVVFKIMVYTTQDISWTPQFQVNFLLQLYLLLFYYQVYLSSFLSTIFKSKKQ